MTSRHHRMPFGAELGPTGTTHFRLWAPGAMRVDLRLGDPPADPQPMEATGGGWFELASPAPSGTCYRFRIDDELEVPDPASRYQPQDVHGPSEVIDPQAWTWCDDAWRGRPWHETVIYELHPGTFTAEGSFDGVRRQLDYLAELGVTALELMPVSDFPGRWNWGYDGVLPFAPDASYGRPEDLKRLVAEAHARDLMVFLDVVYNHFGPEGNYLYRYAPAFFTDRHHTPWGDAINFDGLESQWVRQFFVHNALYWLEEYRMDGLRFDAVHAIMDDSAPDILEEIAAAVARGPGRQRHIHLVLENDNNAAHYLRASNDTLSDYTAQWNDDIHHALHVLATGETGGYYEDYRDQPVRHLARCLAEGFAYQGERSAYRDGRPRGEPTRGLPVTSFVNFLQNHDQVGNRARGERISALAPQEAVAACTALLLLSPSPPLLFMGQEWAAPEPFLFFCDFGDDIGPSVTEGRRAEFARFPEFADAAAVATIPDPMDEATYRRSVIDPDRCRNADSARWLQYHKTLLALRAREVVPRLPGAPVPSAQITAIDERALHAEWTLSDASRLSVVCNLGPTDVAYKALPKGTRLFSTPDAGAEPLEAGTLQAWSTIWYLESPDGRRE